MPVGQDNILRFVREMFSLDQIAVTDKDATAYPAFAAAKSAIAPRASLRSRGHRKLHRYHRGAAGGD